MHRPSSAARSHNEAVYLDQPDYRPSISELTHSESTNTRRSLSMASRSTSNNEAVVSLRSNKMAREASDEAENLIQLQPLNEAALTSYTALGSQFHRSTSTLPVLRNNSSPAGPIKSEYEHEPAKARRFYRKWYMSWIDGWKAEILSCSISAVALFCLIATLRYFEGRVITETPLKININTLVAVLATTIKASLLLAVAEAIGQLKWLWFYRVNSLKDFESFDSASRGPWGAFLLTIQLKMRHLCAFGAIITVLALAIEPFTQQIVRPVICHKTQSGLMARVPRANNCTGLGAHTGPATAALDAGMTAAMYTGLLNSPQAVQAQCYTGNCTFPGSPGTVESYQTLGFTSICVDIENEFRDTDGPATSWKIPSLGNDSEVSPFLGNSTRTLSTGSMYQMQEYPSATFGHRWNTEQNATALLQFAALTVAVDWSCYRDHVEKFDEERCMKPVGAECKLWPAVQSIKALVNLGELQETVTSEAFLQYDERAGSWLHVSPRVLRNGSWHDCTPSKTRSLEQPVPINNNTIWRPRSDDEYPESLQWYTQDCVWTIDYQTDIALREQLNPLFTDRSVRLKSSLGWVDMSWGDVWIKQIYRNGTASASTISGQIGQLASSMTAYNRMMPRPETNLGFAYGDTIKYETCVQVRWPWIAFPATLVVLSSLFLALTIWSTKQDSSSVSGGKVWKTSSLAVLFHGLGEGLLKDQEPMVRKSEMMDRAAKLKVALQFEDDGWKLRAHTNH